MMADTEFSAESEAKLDRLGTELQEILAIIDYFKGEVIALRNEVTILQARLTVAEAKLAKQ
jgi:outer membrane murein-binding lipoprotein Lpp